MVPALLLPLLSDSGTEKGHLMNTKKSERGREERNQSKGKEVLSTVQDAALTEQGCQESYVVPILLMYVRMY